MADTIRVYTEITLNRKTGEVIKKSNPVELNVEEFSNWIEPAIPHLASILLKVREGQE